MSRLWTNTPGTPEQTVGGLVWNDQTPTVAARNHQLIQDSLSSERWSAIIGLADKDQLLNGTNPGEFDRLFIDQPIEYTGGQKIGMVSGGIGGLAPINGANLPAVVAPSHWLNNTGRPPSVDNRHTVIERLTVEGNYQDRLTGNVHQSGGHGHGIVVSGFNNHVTQCVVSHTRGAGLFADTTNEDGTTISGESIECQFNDNLFIRTGLQAIALVETAQGPGGITDFFIVNNVIANTGLRGGVDPLDARENDGAGIFAQTSGGGVIANTHIYSVAQYGGFFTGLPLSHTTHGIAAFTGSGLRIHNCQIDNFGAHRSDPFEQRGIFVRTFDQRNLTVTNNHIYTDAFADPGTHDYVGMLVQSTSGRGVVRVSGNTVQPRGAAIGQIDTGIAVRTQNASDSLDGILSDNTVVDVPIAQQYADGGATLESTYRVVNNSWQ